MYETKDSRRSIAGQNVSEKVQGTKRFSESEGVGM